MFEDAALIICIIIWLFVTVRNTKMLLNLFQQHEYNNSRFIRSIATTPQFFFRPHEILLLIWFAIQVFVPNMQGWKFLTIVDLLLFVLAVAWSYILINRQEKRFVKKLVFTPRLYRLLIILILLLIGEFLALIAFNCKVSLSNIVPCMRMDLLEDLIGLVVILQLTSLTVIAANIVLWPLETFISNYFVATAGKKLKAVNPLVIGITGSYGKTSTKHLIAEILKLEYSEFEVLSTPKSYNTLMGICRVINENLRPHHRYFVVEMGAYKSGEIKKICQLVRPQIGILTAIGPQHLERFKTIENVARAKNELIEALPDNGAAIFNGDDPFCEKLAAGAKVRKLLYGTTSNANFDIQATNISMSIKGTEFDVELKSEKPRHVKMQLLGHHNVSNALAAILVALECGIPIHHAVQSLITIHPFEHRMQLIRTPQEITIIDNAYSSNPVSAKISLDVMQAIQVAGNKILVTPGFAELGVRQDEEHFKLGQNAANICDYVFLIGDDKRVGPMIKGLMDQGFAEERIYVNRSLADARKTLVNVSSPGDIILFENDLPDIY